MSTEAHKARARKWYRENRERKLATQKAWVANNRDKTRQYQSKRYFKDKETKILARRQIQTLVRNGVVKKGECEVCGKAETQAHHDDYSKPLEVRWLCSEHHGLIHRV